MTAIAEDLHALVSNKSCRFSKEEFGSQGENSPCVNSRSFNLSAREGVSLSFTHWKAHEKMLQAESWLQYGDGTRGEWKIVLDQMFI